MKLKDFSLMLWLWLFLFLLLAACGKKDGNEGEYPYGHYEDDKMIGTVSAVTKTENVIEVDISEWRKRDRKVPDMTDEGYFYLAAFSDDTSIIYEDGAEAGVEDIKKGQKVLVNPPANRNDFEGHADEIVLLEMTYEEKYGRLLSHIDGFNLVVMYEYGNSPPANMQEPLYEGVLNILEGTEHDVVGAYIEYDEDYVVDFKEELGIEQFPVILIYDQEELLFTAYNAEDAFDFFWNLEE